MANLMASLQAAGFKGESLRKAWAVAMRESGGNAAAYNGNRATGDDSHGLFQINMLGSMGADRDAKFRQYVKGYTGPDSLKDPEVNARAAYYMTNKGSNWKHWDIDSTGYAGGEHAAKYREWYDKFPGGDMANSRSAADTKRALGRTADDATRWATGARMTYVNRCDRFVANAYGLAHSNYASATAHWNSIPGQFKGSDNTPPVGALVFFNTGKPAGHVAIVTGHDRKGNALVATTHANGGRPTVMPLSTISGGMKYLGWSQPYFQGATAELDEDSTGIYQTPGTAAADDFSGIDNSTEEDLALKGASLEAGIEPDRLSWKEMGNVYGYAKSLLTSVPELRKVFKEASDGQYEEPKIIGMIKSTDWYKNHSEYARNTIMQEAAGGKDYQVLQENASTAVQKMATETGVPLTDANRKSLQGRYMMEGWGKRTDGARLMKAAMAELITEPTGPEGNDFLLGESGGLQASLAEIAKNNGLNLSDQYFTSAAQSLAKGLTTKEDQEREVREMAASQWPTYSEKIMAGDDVKDLASTYTSSMSKILEVDQDAIDLNDPYIRKAMTGIDEQGNPVQTNLYEFETNLRKDPRWQYTKNAQDKVYSMASDIARMFGFTG